MANIIWSFGATVQKQLFGYLSGLLLRLTNVPHDALVPKTIYIFALIIGSIKKILHYIRVIHHYMQLPQTLALLRQTSVLLRHYPKPRDYCSYFSGVEGIFPQN